jgi:hypothetical protein
MVLSIDLSKFPEPIQSVLRVLQLKGAQAAPEFFKAAMSWVWEQEKQYVPSYYFDEINGMAAGLCDSLHGNCNVTEWVSKIEQFNMLPELVKMACTAYGAWGKSTPEGGLTQLRALDFGGGPFANYTVIQTHRPSESANAFISVAFPCMIGVVTGVSQSGIGLSQKVWMVYDENGESAFLPGAYDGEPAVFVLRDILQNSKNRFSSLLLWLCIFFLLLFIRADAEAYLQSVKRTWAIWLGIGDYESQKLDLVAYQQSSVGVYTDETAPSMTGQPFLENIAYVDKHPQVSFLVSNVTVFTYPFLAFW